MYHVIPIYVVVVYHTHTKRKLPVHMSSYWQVWQMTALNWIEGSYTFLSRHFCAKSTVLQYKVQVPWSWRHGSRRTAIVMTYRHTVCRTVGCGCSGDKYATRKTLSLLKYNTVPVLSDLRQYLKPVKKLFTIMLRTFSEIWHIISILIFCSLFSCRFGHNSLLSESSHVEPTTICSSRMN